jgi:lipoyl(octanoyl) transferase
VIRRPAALCELPGLVPYAEALELQHRTVAMRQEREVPDTVLVLCHPPVLTLGRNASSSGVLASAEHLAQLGIEVHRVERGGQATYHGPGQLVAYPILDLEDLGLSVVSYVRGLEQVLICACASLGIVASRVEGIPGAFVGKAKIGAIGVRVNRGVSFHGLSLNIDPNLEHYRLIVPCGMADTPVTSAAQVLGRSPGLEAAQSALVNALGEVLGLDFSRS